MAVKKVILNGNTIMSVEETTAEEKDVAKGKVFFKSNGDRAVGTAEDGGGSSPISTRIENDSWNFTISDNTGNEAIIRSPNYYEPSDVQGFTMKTKLLFIDHIVQYYIDDSITPYSGIQNANIEAISGRVYFKPTDTEITSQIRYRVLNNGTEITSAYLNGDYDFYCVYNIYRVDDEATATLQQSYINQIPVDYDENEKEKLIYEIQRGIKVYVMDFDLTDRPIHGEQTNQFTIVGLQTFDFTDGMTWAEWVATDPYQGGNGSFSVKDNFVIFTVGDGTTNYTFGVLGPQASDTIVAGTYYLVSQWQPTIDGQPDSDPSLYTFTINGQTYKATPNTTFEQWVASANNNSGYVVSGNYITISGPNSMPLTVVTQLGVLVDKTDTINQDNLMFFLALNI